MGAWIEIQRTRDYCFQLSVAPFVGAWIEIHRVLNHSEIAPVAPFVGAWIEIHKPGFMLDSYWSLPSWERGLKLNNYPEIIKGVEVAPFVGAWIEIHDTSLK